MTKAAISRTVEALVAQFLSEGEVDSAYEINCGYCDSFSERLLIELSRLNPVPHAGEIFVDDLLDADSVESDEPRFRRDDLAERHPNCLPPEGLDWEDMDRIALDYDFAGGTHAWVEAEGLHYDAEAPQGVENLFALPFFQRKIEHYLARRAMKP